jgi:hypothetical protein
MRAVREIDREPMTTGKGENTADVITVLVRHHDRRQLIGGAQSGQPGRRHRGSKSRNRAAPSSRRHRQSGRYPDCRCPATRNGSLQLIVEQVEDPGLGAVLRSWSNHFALGLVGRAPGRSTGCPPRTHEDAVLGLYLVGRTSLEGIEPRQRRCPPSSRCRFRGRHNERSKGPCERSRSSTVKPTRSSARPTRPPGTIERFLDLEGTGTVGTSRQACSLDGLFLCRPDGLGRALFVAAEANHQTAQHLGFEFRVSRTWLPLGLILALGDENLVHAAMADEDVGGPRRASRLPDGCGICRVRPSNRPNRSPCRARCG